MDKEYKYLKLVRVSKDIHTQLKVASSKKGVSMTKKLEQICKEYFQSEDVN